MNKVRAISPLPESLRGQRDQIRLMMRARCSQPDSPIPEKLANRVADWIMMMVSYRANERRKSGKQPWANQEELADDIARSAEGIECLFIVAREEVVPPPDIIVARSVNKA